MGSPASNLYRPSRLRLFSSEKRMLLSIILGLSALFMLLAWGLYHHFESSLSDHYDRFGTLIASVVASGGADQITSPLNRELKLRRFVDDMLNDNNDLAAIRFDDANGNVLYEDHKPLTSEATSGPMRFYTARVEAPGRYLGTVSIKLSGRTVHEVAGSTRTMLLIVFACAWLMAILAVSANTYILQSHVRRLVQGVQRLSTGDFGYKIQETDLWGELRTLAESFNDMSMRLRAYEDQNLDTITFERNKLKAVLLSIADGTIVCSNDGEVIIINDSACRHLAIESSELMTGRDIRDYVTTDGEPCLMPVITEFVDHVAQFQGHLPKPFSRQISLPDTTLNVMISPIQDADGHELGFVMTTHDITREAEVDLLKTNFISNVSHELRTPVTTIKSYVDTIYNHGADLDRTTYNEFIETIYEETDRLKKMVNDILDFSRMEEASDQLEMDQQDLTPIINLTVQSFKVLAQQKDLTITTTIESNLPTVMINSDTIERVMRNLLSNAIKYTDAGGRVKVRAELVEADDAIEVSVQDSGIGIAEEHLPQLFDRFYRVENAVHTVKGTGLGLHLVKTAIEKLHGGTVFVKSKANVGSTFGFRLWLNPTEDVTPTQVSTVSAKKSRQDLVH